MACKKNSFLPGMGLCTVLKFIVSEGAREIHYALQSAWCVATIKAAICLILKYQHCDHKNIHNIGDIGDICLC